MSKSYSYNEENFYDEIDDFIDDIDANHEAGEVLTIYQADNVPKKASDFVAPWLIIERAQEDASDELGDCAEYWLDETLVERKEWNKDRVSVEQDAKAKQMRQDLSDCIDAWADKHGLQPRFFGIENIKKIQIKYLGDTEYELLPQAIT